jgi:hypothetical protein
MPYDRQKLTPETVQALVKKIHADKDLKAEVIEAVNAKGFAGMVEEFFEPSERQRKLLDGHRQSPKEMQKLMKDAVLQALATNGKIELTHAAVERTSIGVSVGVGPGGVSIDVSIECLQ